eukprot:1390532-Amorphochlora_amoeboformis.AAC.1
MKKERKLKPKRKDAKKTPSIGGERFSKRSPRTYASDDDKTARSRVKPVAFSTVVDGDDSLRGRQKSQGPVAAGNATLPNAARSKATKVTFESTIDDDDDGGGGYTLEHQNSITNISELIAEKIGFRISGEGKQNKSTAGHPASPTGETLLTK